MLLYYSGNLTNGKIIPHFTEVKPTDASLQITNVIPVQKNVVGIDSNSPIKWSNPRIKENLRVEDPSRRQSPREKSNWRHPIHYRSFCPIQASQRPLPQQRRINHWHEEHQKRTFRRRRYLSPSLLTSKKNVPFPA